MQKFTRTITGVNVQLATVRVVEGKPELSELPTLYIGGEPTTDEIAKLLRKQGYPANTITTGTEKVVGTYEMELDFFLAHATKVPDLTPEEIAEKNKKAVEREKAKAKKLAADQKKAGK